MPTPVRKVAKSFKSMFKKKNLPFSLQSGLEGTSIRGALGLTTKAVRGVGKVRKLKTKKMKAYKKRKPIR